MSAIEFSAQAGKTFSVQLYNATTGVAIGAPVADVTDATTPTLYRVASVASGIVYVVATATNLRVAGFANLDKPGANGYSALVDSYPAATGGGSTSVLVAPFQATLTHKLEGTDFTVATSSTPLIGMNVEDEDRNPVDMDGLVLRLTIESLDKTEKYTLEDASITHSVDSFSFRVPADVTAIAREWNWTLRNTADGEKIVGGNITVEYAP